MIPPLFDSDVLTQIIPTIISSIVILFYIFAILFGLGKTHRLMIWWRFLLTFLIIQQINFIYSYYTNFGHYGDFRCCDTKYKKAYVTFVQTLFGRHSIYYFGYFFAKSSYDLITTKYKKKKKQSIVANVLSLVVLMVDLVYVAVRAYKNNMMIVESFAGRLLPSPTAFLFYLDFCVGLVPLAVIVNYFLKFDKRGFSAKINKKNFFSQRLMTEYSFNYYIPKVTIKFVIVYLMIDQIDSILTFVVHFAFLKEQVPKDGISYSITILRWIYLVIFVLYPSLFVFKYIMKRKIDQMEIKSMKAKSEKMRVKKKRLNSGVSDNLLSSKSSVSQESIDFGLKTIQTVNPTNRALVSGGSKRAFSCRPDFLLPLFETSILKESVQSPLLTHIRSTRKKPMNPEIAAVMVSLLMKKEDIKRSGGTFLILNSEYHSKTKKMKKSLPSKEKKKINKSNFGYLHNVYQHQIEHKEVYKVDTRTSRMTNILEEDWENVNDLVELNYFDGIAVSYFEGITPQNLLKRSELRELISYLYSVLYISEPTIEFFDLSNIVIKHKEIQIIERTTKIYLIKRFLRDYYEYKFQKNGNTCLQNIRSLLSYTTNDCLYKCSFLVLDHEIDLQPVCCYQINLNDFYFLEWGTSEHKFIIIDKDISCLKNKHRLSDKTRLDMINIVSKDLQFLKTHRLKNYQINMNFYYNDKNWDGSDASVFKTDKGNFVCKVVIRKFIPREILSVLANKEGRKYNSGKYSDIILRNFEGFLGAVK